MYRILILISILLLLCNIAYADIIGPPENLNDLGDVTITSPTNDEVPAYNSTTSKWENKAVSGIETDPIVGAVSGIVKADGGGNISVATAGTDYVVTETQTLDDACDLGSTTDKAIALGTTTLEGKLRTAVSATDNNSYFDTYDNGGAAPGKQSILNLRRSDSDTIGNFDATQDGLALGMIKWWGTQGVRFGEAAQIRVLHDGAGGAERPSTMYLEASTGTAINTNQLVLNTNGCVGIGTATPTASLDVDGDLNIEMSAAADQVLISQSSATGTEDQALIYIDDNRTGGTSTENSEATIYVDVAQTDTVGYYQNSGKWVFRGTIYFLDTDAGALVFTDNRTIRWGTGNDVAFYYDTNGTGADQPFFSINPSTSTWNLFLRGTAFNANNMTDHNGYLNPTITWSNAGGADTNDYSAMVTGFMDENDVATDAPRWYLYGMTGAADGAVNATTTELAPMVISGDDKTITSSHSLGSGDWVHGDDFEVQGVTYADGGLVVPSGTTPAPDVVGAIFLDTDESANGSLMVYGNGAWRKVVDLP